MDALVSAVAARDETPAKDEAHEWSVLHSHLHRGQTRLLLAESVQWWVHVDILSEQDAAFQMLLPQLLRGRRQSMHQFLAHSEVDTALVMVLVAAVVSADADVADVDGVDVVDADEAGADGADRRSCSRRSSRGGTSRRSCTRTGSPFRKSRSRAARRSCCRSWW